MKKEKLSLKQYRVLMEVHELLTGLTPKMDREKIRKQLFRLMMEAEVVKDGLRSS